MRNLSRLDNKPAALKEKIFSRVFEAAEIAHFSKSELHEYEDSLKAYRDLKNSLDTAIMQGEERGIEKGIEIGVEKGRAEGHAEGRQKVAKALLAKGLPIDLIAETTELSTEEVQALAKEE